jgi:glucokinase
MVNKLALGVDIGGTKIAFAAVDQQGKVQTTHRIDTNPSLGESEIIDQIANGIKVVLAQIGPVDGIGIGSPGHVDPHSGVIRNAVNLNWLNVALRQELQQRLGDMLPIAIEKDANAAAIGEMYFGAAQGLKDFVLIAIGTGLGVGAISGGALVSGANNFAMELGHFAFDPNGRQCACGLRGCPEMYVSGVGMAGALDEYLPDYPQSSLAQLGEKPSTSDILAATRQNDPLGVRILNEAVKSLSDVMMFCAAAFNPALFVIGGGLGHAAADLMIEPAFKLMQQRTMVPTHIGVRVTQSKVNSSAVGAACLVWYTRQHAQQIGETSAE